MPPRRASASAGHINSVVPSLSTSRLHRSNDSHPFTTSPPHSAPYASSSVSTSPQQKVVQILVNRLKNKVLSIFSFISISFHLPSAPRSLWFQHLHDRSRRSSTTGDRNSCRNFKRLGRCHRFGSSRVAREVGKSTLLLFTYFLSRPFISL